MYMCAHVCVMYVTPVMYVTRANAREVCRCLLDRARAHYREEGLRARGGELARHVRDLRGLCYHDVVIMIDSNIIVTITSITV